MALLFFAITLFVSAFLLFLVQPIIGKMILPKLGGTPQVWNTCMVFFQTALLAGYFYTHTVSTYLKTRTQIIVHCILLLVPFIILLPWGPFNVVAWVPPSGGNPVFATLVLLAIVVGIPFFVVATSAPLLQKWFAATGHPAAKDPYFLYGASNLGSMLALLAYPALVEPFFRLQSPIRDGVAPFDLGTQSWLWTVGYIVLVVMIIGCGAMVFLAPPSVALAGGHGRPGEKEASAVVEPPPPGPEMAAGEKPVTEPGPTGGEPAPPGPTASGVTATPPAPAPTPAPPPPAPKPGPSTAIKKGTKQGKKGGKHHHKHQRPEPQHQQQQQAIAEPRVAASLAPSAPTTAAPTLAPRHPDQLTTGRRVRWVLLAAIPSSLMLGVTTKISEDIAPIPLFWVITLALYLLSFILVFMRWPVAWIGPPHNAALVIQAPLLALLVLSHHSGIVSIHMVLQLIAINLLAFFATALVCHGELAKDRPSTRYLTEFYLWMSVGGMLGGMFNGLLAPVLFTGLWEVTIAIIAAGLIRPVMKDYGWTDMLAAQIFGESEAQRPHKGPGRSIRKMGPVPSRNLTLTLDILLPIAVLVLTMILQAVLQPSRGDTNPTPKYVVMYSIPLVIACFYYARPWRFGLALGLVLLVIQNSGGGRDSLRTERSYFGILHITRGGEGGYLALSMTHGTTQHGQNFLKPSSSWYGGLSPNKEDLSRTATTYYHRTGPVGMAMERFDWFVKLGEFDMKGDIRDVAGFWAITEDKSDAAVKLLGEKGGVKMPLYSSDARMPAALIGSATVPLGQLVTLWSEPPYATIGLGTGTMASYARPFQHMHFYEIDDRVRRYSLPDAPNVEPYFAYLSDARKRGAQVEVLMGDARLRMALPWQPQDPNDPTKDLDLDKLWKDYGPEKMKEYHDKVMALRGGPDSFYHLIVVDAFSSDAIPVHLLTRESLKIYLQKLAPGGVLCIHTSNRHLGLVPVVVDVAGSIYTDKETGQVLPDATPEQRAEAQKKGQPLVSRRGHDNAPRFLPEGAAIPREHLGHTTSEWVIVARKPTDLDYLKVPGNYEKARQAFNAQVAGRLQPDTSSYWENRNPIGQYVWTDDYSNLLAVFRWPWRTRSIE